ncbi:MAG: hypothetical protein M3N47_02315 [Chloroflexota bacterium]|nr:hypothetical protein [Chloroflexota bacterium]
MSQPTHPTARISSPFGTRRTATLLGLLGLVAATLVVLALTLGGSDANTAGSIVSDQPASRTDERPVAPGTRFDGGPEEGTRGPAAAASSPGTRFDGGPEEGTRGPASASSSRSTR